MYNGYLNPRMNGYLRAGDIQDDEGIMEELDGLNGSFDRIKIAGGGELMFEVRGDDGKTELIKEIEGVILYHHAVNSFYKYDYTGGINPPDCGSLNGKYGTGTPGGSCRDCPYNKFGSKKEGLGKACKNRRRVYILKEGDMLPVVLTLPTGSLKEFSNYIVGLLTDGMRSCSVVTRIGLKKAVSSNGIQYGQAEFTTVRDLLHEEAEAVSGAAEFVKEYTGDMLLEDEYGTPPDFEGYDD